MKTTAYLIAALMMLTSLTVFAQGGRGNRNVSFKDHTTCINVIPDLTQEQIQQITSLESAHKSQMDQLRNERRSTRDIRSREDIREKLIQVRDAHRNQVKQLLTPEQQRVYDALPYRGYEGRANSNHSRGNNRNCCR